MPGVRDRLLATVLTARKADRDVKGWTFILTDDDYFKLYQYTDPLESSWDGDDWRWNGFEVKRGSDRSVFVSKPFLYSARDGVCLEERYLVEVPRGE